ncbi:hypothetical protein BP6252_08274 [Coleophoma cylindrospora]|uniref:Thioredoxin domain-containing protein n=1 Tax=Coleophoma cylindrospora TaxID=1849047 RepID=A0A3D8R613_9HELO|nr:hypothetical protein BP6252_08274 [Coleophoma cylindrospora]
MTQDYTYTIYYSARNEAGVMWCPDCRDVESTLASTFKLDQAEGAQAEIIYLTRPDWKSPANQYRHAPWNLTGIPTVLKFSPQGAIVAKIEDADILDPAKLAAFLKQEA